MVVEQLARLVWPAVLLALLALAACRSALVDDNADAAPAIVALPPQPPSQKTCLIIDGDGNLDDLRAVAVVVPHWRLATIVATDGILPASAGAANFARLLAASPQTPQTAVIRGRASASPPRSFDWLAEVRKDAARLDAALAQTLVTSRRIETPNTDEKLSEAMARVTRDCDDLGLLVIGPWSSLVAYHEVIRSRLKFVVSQGRSPYDPAEPDWDRVNCYFDELSCRTAIDRLRTTGIAWVDLPARGPAYPLDEQMIGELGTAPLARALQHVMQQDSQWRRQQVWDDGAAAFVVRPNAFRRVGQHFEPAVSPSEMRHLLSELMNGLSSAAATR